MPKPRWWRTNVVVGSLIGLVLVYVAFTLAGWRWGAMLTTLLLYEGWTLVNSYPADTISETLWRFAQRPMVPWLFGLGSGWSIESRYITDPWLILSLGFLSGHFFFQAQDEGEEEEKEKEKDE